MSINKVVKTKDKHAPLHAERHNIDNHEEITDQDYPSIDKTPDNDANAETGDYSGRKHKQKIDGVKQASQETDEIYEDPRKTAGLPPAGKNVGDLNAHDLGRHDKK